MAEANKTIVSAKRAKVLLMSGNSSITLTQVDATTASTFVPVCIIPGLTTLGNAWRDEVARQRNDDFCMEAWSDCLLQLVS